MLLMSPDGAAPRHRVVQGNAVLRCRELILTGNQLAIDDDVRSKRFHALKFGARVFKNRLREAWEGETVSQMLFQYSVFLARISCHMPATYSVRIIREGD